MKEEAIKHLEFIQNIITRMNTNSFQLKRMFVIIISALLAVYASEKNPDFILITILPLILFWFLDSYYLQQERKFRGLYNDLLNGNPHNVKPFEMKPNLYKRGRYSFRSAFLSKTISTVYISVAIVVSFIYIYLKYFKNG